MPSGVRAAVSLRSLREAGMRFAPYVFGKMMAKTTMLSWSGAVRTARCHCFRRGRISQITALAIFVTAKTCAHPQKLNSDDSQMV